MAPVLAASTPNGTRPSAISSRPGRLLTLGRVLGADMAQGQAPEHHMVLNIPGGTALYVRMYYILKSSDQIERLPAIVFY